MALSDYEKEVLAELEAEFASDTTAHGTSAHRAAQEFHRQATQPDSEPARGPLSPRRIAIGLIAAVLGISGLLTAVTIGYSALSIAVGIASFVVAVLGVYYAIHQPHNGGATTALQSGRTPSGRTGGAAKKTSTPNEGLRGWYRRFMEDQQRRWDERDQR